NLWLTRFRNYAEAELAPAPGLTVVLGDNGQGKTNLLEGIGYAATLSSFRGVGCEALVEHGHDRAAVRLAPDSSGREVRVEALGTARQLLVERIEPALAKAYEHVAGEPLDVNAAYDAPWRAEGLRLALERARTDELRRGTTLAGPHRDELSLSLDGVPARTHASQGEQRSLALALRLAAHTAVIEDTGDVPVLLLDDVFSELDPSRSEALVHHLPEGQALLTTAAGQPPGTRPELVVRVSDAHLHVVDG